MSTSSNIEWTDATWNPVVGCTPVSPGCLNCYAATMARRLEAMGRAEYQPRLISDGATKRRSDEGEDPEPGTRNPRSTETLRIAEVRGGRAVFTGLVREVPDRLDAPLHWRKPRRIFVNSMSDLFHEAVSFEFIDRVFAVMALCPQHTFQVLTKRPERMAEYLRGLDAAGYIQEIRDHLAHAARDLPTKPGAFSISSFRPEWPMRNVWLGTSVEDQQRADERIPHLLRCPAAVRFLSCEPLIGPVDLKRHLTTEDTENTEEGGGRGVKAGTRNPAPGPRLHWVIVGGESGPNARPCNDDWIRSIVEQCKSAGVPCFVKQLGAWPRGLNGATALVIRDRKGADIAEWPAELQVREMPATERRPPASHEATKGSA